VLRAYARPYPQATAGVPLHIEFDSASGILNYSYKPVLANGDRPDELTTEIRVPAINYPRGYEVVVEGGEVVSPPGSSVLRVRNQPGASKVAVTLARVGDLPPIPAATSVPGGERLGGSALGPVPEGPLNRNSLLGHIVLAPGGRESLETAVPGMLAGLSHVHGWEQMTPASLQQLAAGTFTEAKLAEIDAALAALHPRPVPVQRVRDDAGLSIDTLTSDLLADPRSRAIIEREAPGLLSSNKQALFPQTTLRNLQPAMQEILTDEVLKAISQALAEF
jgi:endoglycosylceramidase